MVRKRCCGRIKLVNHTTRLYASAVVLMKKNERRLQRSLPQTSQRSRANRIYVGHFESIHGITMVQVTLTVKTQHKNIDDLTKTNAATLVKYMPVRLILFFSFYRCNIRTCSSKTKWFKCKTLNDTSVSRS